MISAGMRLWADYAERNAKGTITDADIAQMEAALGVKLDAWQAEINAHRAKA